jgi:hypothetical protein
MIKWIVGFFMAAPLMALAQLPLPVLPDWLKPNQKTAEVLNQTHVTLTSDNYYIVEPNVIARSRGFKLLGIITFRGASYSEAMSRLYSKAGVQQGHPQALANVVHESSSTYLILFSIPKVTIRADLIEFTSGEPQEEMGDPSPVLLKANKRKR